jgi:hypothetical protein
MWYIIPILKNKGKRKGKKNEKISQKVMQGDGDGKPAGFAGRLRGGPGKRPAEMHRGWRPKKPSR